MFYCILRFFRYVWFFIFGWWVYFDRRFDRVFCFFVRFFLVRRGAGFL